MRMKLSWRGGRLKGKGSILRHVFAGQNVGVTQVGERIWLVSFMQYDLGYFDDETCRLEPIANPFGPKVLPLRAEESVTCPLRKNLGKWLLRLDSNQQPSG